jgi:hypothetical protein
MDGLENFSSPEGSLNLQKMIPNPLPIALFPKDEIKIDLKFDTSMYERDNKNFSKNYPSGPSPRKKKFLYSNKKSDKMSKHSIKKSDLGNTGVSLIFFLFSWEISYFSLFFIKYTP